ncbi:MAG: hypothetical protein LBE82_12240 [Chitinophagaceae bacterium]|nr:hypothetical protein [Chitinophagaceae bacterium]
MVLFVAKSFTSSAQTNNSPYSIFGIGDIENNYYDRSSGMGNSGIGLSSGKYIYQANPASLGQLESHYFTVEFGGNYKYVSYTGNPIGTITTPTSQQFQMTRFVLAVKPKPYWGVGIGLMPYSSSNYTFFSIKNVQGSNTASIPAYYEGSGGLNQVFLTNALNINRHFSLGIRASFIFGSLQQSETLYPVGAVSTPENPLPLSNQLNTLNLLAFRNFNYQGGLQYRTKLSKKWGLSLGAVGSSKTNFSPEHRVTLTEGNPANGLPTTLVNDSLMANSRFTIPFAYGGGLSLNYDGQITLAADYKRQNWSDVQNPTNGSYTFNNSERWSGGLEYAIPKTAPFRGQLLSYEKYFFQVGGFRSKDYLRIRGTQLTNTGITLGVGINGNPARSTTLSYLSYMLNFQFGTLGTTSNNLIKQNYLQVGFIISYRDFWQPRIALD